jgi:hypothetical protein
MLIFSIFILLLLLNFRKFIMTGQETATQSGSRSDGIGK